MSIPHDEPNIHAPHRKTGTTFAEIDQNSICIFVEKLPDGNRHALGTGCFFMRRDLVLTAKHVLEDVVQQNRQVFIANGSKEGTLFGGRPQLFCPHPKVDLALVKVSEDDLTIERPLFPAHFPMHRDAGNVAIGYDREQSENRTNSWVLSANRVSSFDSEVRERSGGHIEYTLHFSADWMKPGYSGGPVISLGGGVVAVLTEQFSHVEESSATVKKAMGRATAVYPILDLFKSPFEWMPLRTNTHDREST